MHKPHSLWMAWSFLLAYWPVVWAEPPAATDYLLLKNGAVLTGRIVRDGEVYVVRNPNSSGESRYPASLAVKLCTSAQEVYGILKKHAIPDEAKEHCRLATFCIAHQLFKEADEEIAAALKCDRRCVEALVLRKQLVAKQKEPADKQETLPTLPASTVLPQAVSLEDWPVAMQPQIFQDFSRRIQPMLLVGCGTGACHGNMEGKRAFTLKKGLYGVVPSPTVSRTNLERTLSLVNAEKPDASELLKRALTPHGLIKTWPVTAEQHAAFRQWVHVIAGKQAEVAQPQGETKSKQGSVGFASHGDTPPETTSPVKTAEGNGSLPAIPGMSGGALQQLGGTVPAKEQTPPAEQSKSSGGLPSIPGLSGKGQGNAPPPKSIQPGSNQPPKAKIKPQDQPAYYEYARRLGFTPGVASPMGSQPDRLHIVNAGTYSESRPPPVQFSDELLEKMKLAESGKSKDKEKEPPPPAFVQTGSVVSGPK